MGCEKTMARPKKDDRILFTEIIQTVAKEVCSKNSNPRKSDYSDAVAKYIFEHANNPTLKLDRRSFISTVGIKINKLVNEGTFKEFEGKYYYPNNIFFRRKFLAEQLSKQNLDNIPEVFPISNNTYMFTFCMQPNGDFMKLLYEFIGEESIFKSITHEDSVFVFFKDCALKKPKYDKTIAIPYEKEMLCTGSDVEAVEWLFMTARYLNIKDRLKCCKDPFKKARLQEKYEDYNNILENIRKKINIHTESTD